MPKKNKMYAKKMDMGGRVNSPSNSMDKLNYVPEVMPKRMVDNAPMGAKAPRMKSKMNKYKA